MIVGILGLGLIGGSLARAYAKAGHTVYVCEKDESMLEFAQIAGVVHAPLNQENIGRCDLILLACILMHLQVGLKQMLFTFPRIHL